MAHRTDEDRRRYDEKYPAVVFRLRPSALTTLTTAAERLDQSRSEVIRTAIDAYLDSLNDKDN